MTEEEDPELAQRRKSARNAVQPLYMQIKEALRERILSGEFATEERLPSEKELELAHGVSRITVRQALRDLQAEGLIYSIQGKGTFIAKAKASQDVRYLEGFSEAMSAQGYRTSSRVLSLCEATANEAVAAALELAEGAPVVAVRRIRMLDENPISLDESYFPIEIGRELFRLDVTGDIFAVLERDLELSLDRGELEIEAALASASLAAHLEIETGAPVLRIQRLTRTADGRPVDFEYLSYRGDAYQYRIAISRRREIP